MRHLALAALAVGFGLATVAETQALPGTQRVFRNQADIDPGTQFDRLYRPERYMQRHDLQPRRMMRDETRREIYYR